MGIIQSTTFIHLAASLAESEIAIAGTALYLAQNLFLLIGIQLANAILHLRLRATLSSGLEGINHKSKVRLLTPSIETRIHTCRSLSRPFRVSISFGPYLQ